MVCYAAAGFSVAASYTVHGLKAKLIIFSTCDAVSHVLLEFPLLDLGINVGFNHKFWPVSLLTYPSWSEGKGPLTTNANNFHCDNFAK